MSGRGRGWVLNKPRPDRRPVQASENVPDKSMKNEECNTIVNLIEKLDFNDFTSDLEIHEIEKVLIDAATNNKLKKVFDELYGRALDDRQFGTKFAFVFSNKTIYSLETNDGLRLQILLLKELQKTYDNHEELHRKSISQFRNAASLLGEVYNRLRIASRPLKILGKPLLDYMKLLLEHSVDSDVELVTTLMSINGRNIYENNQEELDTFMEMVKNVIINRNVSPRSRGMLLFLIDLAHQRYNPLSGELQNFYVSQLGTETFISIQRHTDLLTINTKAKNQIGDGQSDSVSTKSETKSTDSVGILMTAPKSENSVKQESQEKKRVVNNDRPINSGNVPRAIRGSGATDQRNLKKSPRGKKEKLTDEQVWSSKQNSSSKGWRHDDRFDKDYD